MYYKSELFDYLNNLTTFQLSWLLNHSQRSSARRQILEPLLSHMETNPERSFVYQEHDIARDAVSKLKKFEQHLSETHNWDVVGTRIENYLSEVMAGDLSKLQEIRELLEADAEYCSTRGQFCMYEWQASRTLLHHIIQKLLDAYRFDDAAPFYRLLEFYSKFFAANEEAQGFYYHMFLTHRLVNSDGMRALLPKMQYFSNQPEVTLKLRALFFALTANTYLRRGQTEELEKLLNDFLPQITANPYFSETTWVVLARTVLESYIHLQNTARIRHYYRDVHRYFENTESLEMLIHLLPLALKLYKTEFAGQILDRIIHHPGDKNVYKPILPLLIARKFYIDGDLEGARTQHASVQTKMPHISSLDLYLLWLHTELGISFRESNFADIVKRYESIPVKLRLHNAQKDNENTNSLQFMYYASLFGMGKLPKDQFVQKVKDIIRKVNESDPIAQLCLYKHIEYAPKTLAAGLSNEIPIVALHENIKLLIEL